jgi:hypothetical protein
VEHGRHYGVLQTSLADEASRAVNNKNATLDGFITFGGYKKKKPMKLRNARKL